MRSPQARLSAAQDIGSGVGGCGTCVIYEDRVDSDALYAVVDECGGARLSLCLRGRSFSQRRASSR